jgi:FAD/FMN-containing dehydrogenase
MNGSIAQGLDGIRQSSSPGELKIKSRDYFWFSPILRAQLDGKTADLIVYPTTEAEIAQIVRHAVRTRTPLVARGGGTGNYGQCVPLAGGIVMDMKDFNGIVAIDEWSVTAQAGIRIDLLQEQLHARGKELRLYPSSQRMASLGGFLGGGNGGVGSATWGMLREPGNVLSVRLMTAEETPRILTLRATEIEMVLHAYGTTGILLDIQLPLAPAYPWVESMWAFRDMAGALDFSAALAATNGIPKRDIATIQQGIPHILKPLGKWVEPDESIVLASTWEGANEAVDLLAARHGVHHRFRFTAAQLAEQGLRPNYEYGWNHATLNFLRADSKVTYLQCGYPLGRQEESIAALDAALGEEARVQLQWVRIGNHITCVGLHIIRYTTPERLIEIAAIHRSVGISLSNCHSFECEKGGEPLDTHLRLAAYRATSDPFGILNPGKLRSGELPADPSFDGTRIPQSFAL